jgi:hypothetical protein
MAQGSNSQSKCVSVGWRNIFIGKVYNRTNTVALLELLKKLFINRIFEGLSFDFSIDKIYIANL